MTRCVALLRGINVGGRTLKMDQLRRIVEDAGGTGVATYIQSGNVLLSHRRRSTTSLADHLSAAIEDATGMTVPVVVRTASEWDLVVESNPFPEAGGTSLHVVFLATEPPPTALDGLDLASFAPEGLAIRGREIYLHLPKGMGRAELPTALDRLGGPVRGTARNWNTVLKLQELLRAD